MVKITIDPPLPPIDGLVKLSGSVTIDDDDFTCSDLAIMPFVWQFTPPHSGGPEHGWREGALHRFYAIEPDGTWKIVDAKPGLQYALFVVPAHLLLEEQAETGVDEAPAVRGDGALPEDGFIAGPEFTVVERAVHIESTPDDHLTGAVMGVSRADGFRMMAWATKPDGTYLIGEARCDASGYWTFGDVKSSLKSGETFTVALVNEDFDAVSPIPPRGPNVVGLRTHPRTLLLKQGAGKNLKRP
jgi:hypothetical protein